MTPYTDDQLEADFRAAINTGDRDRITALGRQVDHRHPPTATPVTVTTLAAALWFAEQDLHVFPLQPASKIPYRGTRGCKDATSDPDRIRDWWTTHPDANVGLATGHRIDVVDIDGHTGHRSRLDHWDTFEQLHVLAKVTTPRPGGMHLYVPATDRGNKAGLLPGIDYRGAGGYVVAPPSHTDQGHYRFLTPLVLDASAAAA